MIVKWCNLWTTWNLMAGHSLTLDAVDPPTQPIHVAVPITCCPVQMQRSIVYVERLKSMFAAAIV